MGKQQDREKIVQEIKIAADLYRKHLVGKRFLYVFEGRYIEVLYKAANFRHLTGVATNLSAKKFYSYAAKKLLQASQIFFTPQHPFSLCKRKIKHIGQIAMLAGSEGFMLEEIVTDTRTYKFGTTDLNFTLCLNKEYDDQGRKLRTWLPAKSAGNGNYMTLSSLQSGASSLAKRRLLRSRITAR